MTGALKVAIMQPYFLPYIGYWQLMSYVDVFVVYDNIKYTKKGWINRNRFLLNGKPETFTLPLKNDHDLLDICQRQLANSIDADLRSLNRRLQAAYRGAPCFDEGAQLIEEVLASKERNLFHFLQHSIEKVREKLQIKSRIVVSSEIGVSNNLRMQERVIATCKEIGAAEYVNPIGGRDLYDRAAFLREGIHLHFQEVEQYSYSQYEHDFVPHLSIIDSIMFQGVSATRSLLGKMRLC